MNYFLDNEYRSIKKYLAIDINCDVLEVRLFDHGDASVSKDGGNEDELLNAFLSGSRFKKAQPISEQEFKAALREALSRIAVNAPLFIRAEEYPFEPAFINNWQLPYSNDKLFKPDKTGLIKANE